MTGFIKQAEAGLPIKQLCRKGGFSDATFYKWRAKYGGMEVRYTRRLRELKSENGKLKKPLQARLSAHSAANLAVRKRKKAKRLPSERVPLQLARGVSEVRRMGFVSDSLSTGRRTKWLTLADDFSHECVSISVGGNLGQCVTRLPDLAAVFRGYPLAVRTDDGPEFTRRALMAWGQHARHPARPDQAGQGPCRTAVSRASTESSGTSV